MADKKISAQTNHVTDFTNKPRFPVADDPTGTPVAGYMDTDDITDIAGVEAAAQIAAQAATDVAMYVKGPAGATDGNLAVFDGATGLKVKDGGAIPAGGVGDFTGPGSSVSWDVVVFDDTSGKAGLDSGVMLCSAATQNTFLDLGSYPSGITTAQNNLGAGYSGLGGSLTEGQANTSFGQASQAALATGDNNTSCGNSALFQNASGDNNTAVGTNSLLAITTTDNNIGVGFSAGRYETGSDKLFIDSIDRTSEALGHTNSLIYGVMDATPANQELHVNAKFYTKSIHTAFVVSTSTSITATAADCTIYCNSTSSVTVDLPAATGTGLVLNIKNVNTGVVTLDGNSGDTIDGSATKLITLQYGSFTIQDYASGKWAIL